MTNINIFEMLQHIECELFYVYSDMASTEPGHASAKEAHEAAQKALVAFYNFMKESEKKSGNS